MIIKDSKRWRQMPTFRFSLWALPAPPVLSKFLRAWEDLDGVLGIFLATPQLEHPLRVEVFFIKACPEDSFEFKSESYSQGHTGSPDPNGGSGTIGLQPQTPKDSNKKTEHTG